MQAVLQPEELELLLASKHRPNYVLQMTAYHSCLSVQAVLQPEELKLLLASKHRPNYVLQILSGLVESSCIVSPERFRMDQNITFFMDAQGSCERILKTPIPLSYTRWAVLVVVLLGLGLVLVLVLVLVSSSCCSCCSCSCSSSCHHCHYCHCC